MKIYGIGHDIVENERMARLFEDHGQSIVKKILSISEQEILKTKNNKARFLAKRFAAKEAFAKACGTGFRRPIIMPEISVHTDDLGRPYFVLSHDIMKWLNQRKINQFHLSISDENEISSAFVILECS